jgi:uncharacterized protein YneF (UPF0154 family)
MTNLLDMGLAVVGAVIVAIAVGILLGLWIKRGRR